MRISVIGAGINGLASAWALARDGHTVTVFEQNSIPNPLGSSFDQTRLIRFPYGANIGYTQMVSQAYDAWDALWADLGERLYVRTGTLAIGRDENSWTDASAETLERLDIPVRKLTASGVEHIFPMLRGDGIRLALFLESGGVLFPSRILEALARNLEHRGVTLRPNSQVRAIDIERARVTLGDGAHVDADALIVAAGPWLTRLFPAMASRVTPSRQVVVYAQPPAEYAEHWKHGPMLMDLDGEGFYLVPPVGGADIKVGDHHFSLQGQPDVDREPTEAETLAVFARARRALRDFERYQVMLSRTCFYTVEPSERFIVEQAGRAWIVSACSGHGFKFGPLTGLAVADGVAGRRPAHDISVWAAGEMTGAATNVSE